MRYRRQVVGTELVRAAVNIKGGTGLINILFAPHFFHLPNFPLIVLDGLLTVLVTVGDEVLLDYGHQTLLLTGDELEYYLQRTSRVSTFSRLWALVNDGKAGICEHNGHGNYYARGFSRPWLRMSTFDVSVSFYHVWARVARRPFFFRYTKVFRSTNLQ